MHTYPALLGTCVDGVQFCCPSCTYPAIRYCTNFPFLKYCEYATYILCFRAISTFYNLLLHLFPIIKYLCHSITLLRVCKQKQIWYKVSGRPNWSEFTKYGSFGLVGYRNTEPNLLDVFWPNFWILLTTTHF